MSEIVTFPRYTIVKFHKWIAEKPIMVSGLSTLAQIKANWLVVLFVSIIFTCEYGHAAPEDCINQTGTDFCTTLYDIRSVLKIDQVAGLTGAGVKVAIIDTGIDYNNQALGAGFENRVTGYDFGAVDNDPIDPNGHGTAVAGVLGA
ncbi:MAG: hypothetical protein KDD62_07540, partial [Bdellovibrionales bacterium]|nr:hypothetical protein [Bdellovibrionales bacterium]